MFLAQSVTLLTLSHLPVIVSFPHTNSPGYHLLNCQVLSHQIPLPSFPPISPTGAGEAHPCRCCLPECYVQCLSRHPILPINHMCPENDWAQQKETPVFKNKLFLSLVIETMKNQWFHLGACVCVCVCECTACMCMCVCMCVCTCVCVCVLHCFISFFPSSF